ncbi:dioxygenase [Herbaspirillum rubrisubalbicans]|jgi:D-methionine transport system substrate-binding protein|uniref:Lipoprotein n=1 Tax=Herbaspirillum rubrisubalbicans TaxID=80842 RepID=A0AAD0XFX0_9BURK|nr:MetQ/NlpA family ABC transporter substrate-binding protein [Herbaspirillum rubrisubalbicans]ALU88008.1 ABC-type metal ion transport system, periplasmic component/surface antigen protein [Herbaspirillum rubrisubalbicans M1]AYR23089.1 MetQ/NlpA family lipoprotein [Herbaspirillum rubrisubalbicans]MCP1576254.1 D-methionine transport system substrate-binding protein [Herbaspirillum rubrisubalbicans]NQE48990.1 dioxygenase [Herbaspirillum rubrisubalbicans]RAM62162.1 dioxygenase [Herbaspirillum rub
MKRRQLIQFIAGLGLAAGLVCAPAMAEDQIKMGVTAGPHAEIMEQVKKLLEKDGVQMKIIEFTDYIQPNAALAAGDLDANSYQHQPYLDAQIKDRGYKFVSVGSTITFPMGVYSKKIKSLNDLKPGARVGVPNDPTNGGRALLVLQAKGVIKLKADAGLKATPLDIVENPKKIKIVELDAAQLPRSLDDFDAAVINGNYAESAGLSPTKDAIAVEASTGPYANVIAVRIADKDKPWVAKLVKAYHSPEVKKFVLEKYKGSVITSW